MNSIRVAEESRLKPESLFFNALLIDLEKRSQRGLSSTPQNHNLLLLNELRVRDLGVAPGAVVWARVEWHG